MWEMRVISTIGSGVWSSAKMRDEAVLERVNNLVSTREEHTAKYKCVRYVELGNMCFRICQ